MVKDIIKFIIGMSAFIIVVGIVGNDEVESLGGFDSVHDEPTYTTCDVYSINVVMPDGSIQEYGIDDYTITFKYTDDDDYTSYEVLTLK